MQKTSLQEAQRSVKGEDVIVSRTINCCVRINKKDFGGSFEMRQKKKKGRSSETRQGRLSL
jgi:hypothetical protein